MRPSHMTSNASPPLKPAPELPGRTQLNWLASLKLHLPQQHTHIPSYYPYNTDMAPRRLNYIATNKVHALDTRVGGCRDIASSDHEPAILTAECAPRSKPPPGPSWGLRQLVKDHQQRLSEPDHVAGDREAITQRATYITTPSTRGRGFRESEQLKQARRDAHAVPAGAARKQAWKGVAKALKAERRLWQCNLVAQAATGSWGALRTLKAERSSKPMGSRVDGRPAGPRQTHRPHGIHLPSGESPNHAGCPTCHAR